MVGKWRERTESVMDDGVRPGKYVPCKCILYGYQSEWSEVKAYFIYYTRYETVWRLKEKPLGHTNIKGKGLDY